jgi:hypothetical protein
MGLFRLYKLRWVLRFLIPIVLGYIVIVTVYYVYAYLRGRRNRDQGLPCVHCQRTAFPLEGSRKRYRCWNCGLRFDGPEHF